jgi:hypothetical protein
MSSPLLTKTIEDKRYLWLEGTNQYLVLGMFYRVSDPKWYQEKWKQTITALMT